jgi:cytochrome c553
VLEDAEKVTMSKTKLTAVAWGLLLAAWIQAAPAATTTTPGTPYDHGSVQNGASKAALCFACHGPNGNSVNPAWPTLAGQSAQYVAEQLRLFRAHVRDNPVMMPLAAGLADADIDDLAVFFAAQTPTGLEADPSYWKSGQMVYLRGDTSRSIPACTACHGPIGRGNLAGGYPALRGQQSVYTMKQLNDYAQGTRYSGASAQHPASPNGYIMTTIAKRLTPEDIRNVASYVQGLR